MKLAFDSIAVKSFNLIRSGMQPFALSRLCLVAVLTFTAP